MALTLTRKNEQALLEAWGVLTALRARSESTIEQAYLDTIRTQLNVVRGLPLKKEEA